MKRLSLPYYYSRSGAKFEPTDSFLNHSVVVDTNKEKLDSAGIPIAQIDRDTYATTSDEMHCFVIGETGCGKTRRVIFPSIRLLAKAGDSMVISDPKGELYRETADILRKKGYSVKVLNFRNPRCGDRWNPLSEIEELYRTQRPENIDKAGVMLDDIVSIISQGIESSKDPYWELSSASLFRGIAQLIMSYGNVGHLTFENIAITANRLQEVYSSDDNRFSQSTKDIAEFIKDLPKDSSIKENISGFINNATNTRNCIYSTFKSMIAPYRSQELLNDLLYRSEIDLDAIGKVPTALFIVLPDDSDAMYPIATCFIKQVYSALVNLADSQPTGQLPNRVTFLLDEFANFAKLPTIHAMLTAARSRRIRFVLVCQSMNQLIEKYTEPGMEIMLSNCRVWLYMSCRNLPFLQRLETLMGDYVSPYTNERCPLVSISDMQHFEMGQVLVLNDRCKPVIGYLDDYSKYDFGEEGFGEKSAPPAPRPMCERRLFSLDDAIKQPALSDLICADIKKQYSGSASDLAKANEYIQNIKENKNVLNSKTMLAYLIRRNKVNPAHLLADFDLDVESLLRQGCRENNSLSIMNLALHLISKEDYDRAFLMMKAIPKNEFSDIIIFWHDYLWEIDKDEEGALISIVCYMTSVFPKEKDLKIQHENMLTTWLDRVHKNPAYSKFLRNPSVRSWLTDSDSDD